ncbi:hypothetical protein FRC12_001470 [Ceratobasidium sp. 428]|nr:hypothetical protein FRC12_001470 [Ceratobasidium sp. 428]
MASANFPHRMAEYRAYFNRDPLDRDLSDLVDLLDRLFPSLYPANMSDPPDYPLPKDDPRYNPSWLPENPPLPPLPVQNPLFDLASEYPTGPPSSHATPAHAAQPSAAQPPAVQPPVNCPVFDGRVDHANLNDSHRSNFDPSARLSEDSNVLPPILPSHSYSSDTPLPCIPFLSAGGSQRHPTLPPLVPPVGYGPHSAPQTPAAPHSGQTTGFYGASSTTTPSAFGLPRPPSLIFHDAHPPARAMPSRPASEYSEPSPHAHAPDYIRPSPYVSLGQWPQASASHMQTGSITLSYGSANPTLGNSYTSNTSTDSPPTPNTSSGRRVTTAWRPRTYVDRNRHSSVSNPDAMAYSKPLAPSAPPSISPAAPAAIPPAVRPPEPPRPRAQPVARAPVPPSPPRSFSNKPHTPQPGLANMPPDVIEPEPRTGGEPYISPEEEDELFGTGVGPKTKRTGRYLNCEFAKIIDHLTGIGVPDSRLRAMLSPGSVRKIANFMAEYLFRGSRNAMTVMNIWRRIRDLVREIAAYAKRHNKNLEFDFSNEEALLRILRQHLDEMRAEGLITYLEPYVLLLFVRCSWYFRLSRGIEDHPAATTSTTTRSGAISPARSAPSRLITQPQAQQSSSAPPTALPRSSTALSTTGSQHADRSGGMGHAWQPPPFSRPVAASHLPSAPPSVTSSSHRTASDGHPRSTSSLRAPRQPTSVRSSRRAASAVGSASPRPTRAASVAAPSVAAPTAPPAAAPPVVMPPYDVVTWQEGTTYEVDERASHHSDTTGGHALERTRDQQRFRQRSLQYREQQV